MSMIKGILVCDVLRVLAFSNFWDLEYMFLSAGKFMPGMEKLAGELFFPTNQQLFLTTEGSKNSWF